MKRLTVNEFAALSGVSARTVRRWCNDYVTRGVLFPGAVGAVRVGKRAFAVEVPE